MMLFKVMKLMMFPCIIVVQGLIPAPLHLLMARNQKVRTADPFEMRIKAATTSRKKSHQIPETKGVVIRRTKNKEMNLDLHGIQLLEAEIDATERKEKRYGARTDTLRRSAEATRIEADADGNGAFLHFQTGGRDLARFDVALGKLPENIRTIGLSRIKRWWMAPSFNNTVPVETQFLLIEIPYSIKRKLYVLFLPLISEDGTFRCTLWNAAKRNDKQMRLRARCESGDKNIRRSEVRSAMWIGGLIANDPSACHDLIERGIKEVALLRKKEKNRFRPLVEKKIPKDVLSGLGWCTWDAFYSAVDAQDIVKGLDSIAQYGTRVQRLIIDDGWMQLDRDFEHHASHNKDEGKAILSEVPSSQDIESSAAITEQSTKALLSGVTLTGESVSKSAATYLYQTKQEEMRSFYDAFTTYVQRLGATTLGALYSNIVESGNDDGIAVTLWRWAATSTPLRNSLIEFYDDHTDFTRRLAWPPRPHISKFNGIDGMYRLIQDAKEKFGVKHVTCWHAVAGTWGGVSESDDFSDPLRLERLHSKATPHLRHIEPSIAWDPASLKGLTTPTNSAAVSALYDDLYASLKECGVDAVKADAQSGVGPLGHKHGGGPISVRMFVNAMENAAQKYFVDNDDALAVTNCMCHSTENLYSYFSSAIARASDDFYPRDEGSWRFHLTACAFNSMFISTISFPDYDMFQSRHEAGWLHAAARAVSGGPVTLSDAPGLHDPDILKAIALPDGSTLLAEAPARLTGDCIFNDVTSDQRTPLKLVAPNACGGAVIGVFNVQGSTWSRQNRRFEQDNDSSCNLKASIHLNDALTAYQHPLMKDDTAAAASALAISEDSPFVAIAFDPHNSRPKILHDFRKKKSLTHNLDAGDFAVYTLARIRTAHNDIHWAPIGLINMLNGGAAVREVIYKPEDDSVEILAKGPGTFAIFSESRPERILIDDVPIRFNYHDHLLSFDLPFASMDSGSVYRIKLNFSKGNHPLLIQLYELCAV